MWYITARNIYMTDIRLQRGQEIANKTNQIKRIDEHTYKVKSQSSDNYYDVISGELGWLCSCADHMFRGVTCKHIHAVEFSLALRQTVVAEARKVEPILNTSNCIFCQSTRIVKFGIRHNESGDIQKFRCNDCKHYFTINLGFEKMHATPQIITSAMQLYFTGESLRNVQKFSKLQGISISHVAIYKWIGRYVSLMEKYLDKITPNVSNVWRADELYLKVKGNIKYLFALMDDETRFWIAQQVSDRKNSSDIRPLFKQGKEVAGKRPKVLITDGARNFNDAYVKEFFAISNPRTKHIRHIRWQGDNHNNKMERMNGEIRDREKIMRELKKQNTPILKGYQIYHNYLRPHEALDNKTPAEACGIKLEGENKWITLIENASIV